MEIPRYLIEDIFKQIVDKAYKARSGNKLTLCGRCPICNEGSSKSKKRFYLYEESGSFNVFCHNCNYSKSFINFLKEKYPSKYDGLKSSACDSLKLGTLIKKKEYVSEKEKLPSQSIHDFLESFYKNNCIKLNELQTHEKKEKWRKYAVKILVDRNIPEYFINKCFLCYKGHYEWRIIIPFINNEGLYYNFQARDVHPKPNQERKDKKYIFANFGGNPELPDDKIFNKYSVDSSKTVYIFEGIFKSLFVKNSVALCNANVTGSRSEEIRKLFPKRIWILDSPWKDKTGCEATIKLLKMNETCFIMPKEHADCKDMDELAKKLNVTEFSEEYINKNLYTGASGLLQLKSKMYKMGIK